MKLYTEEEIQRLLGKQIIFDENDLDKLTPIELPSDKQIDSHVKDDFVNSTEVHKYPPVSLIDTPEVEVLVKEMRKAGMLRMRDKIKGGNNEQK